MKKTYYPVIYQPGHKVVGKAATRQGAINIVSRRVSLEHPKREYWGATLAETLEGVTSWFVSPHLRTKKAA